MKKQLAGLLCVFLGFSDRSRSFGTASDVLLNILLVMSDDQNIDTISCYGRNSHAVSPNVDRLAKEGLFFENALQYAIRCFAIISGKCCHHNGVYNFNDNAGLCKRLFPWFCSMKRSVGRGWLANCKRNIIVAAHSDRGRGKTMDDFIPKDFRAMLLLDNI